MFLGINPRLRSFLKMQKIEYIIKELQKSKYQSIIKKIEHHEGVKQISLDLQANELYSLFTTLGLKEIIKDLLDNKILLVVHGNFPEKKSYCYKEYDGIYLEYKFTKEFIKGQKNETHPIPKQEIFFSKLN